jgi:CPA1 family monovalent cation:H+ antiporter
VLEAVVIVLVTILVLGALSRRLGLVEPPVLLLGGLAIGLVHQGDDIALPPELILTIVLPALLYWEALTTSLREVRANLRVIVLLAVGLVLFTTPIVAATLHEFNGTDWPTAFIIGAVLAPTDAAAVAAIAFMLPRRFMTILRAESLINDGTALVIVAAAVEVAVGGERVHWGSIWLDLVLAYAGGVAIGAGVAGVIILIRRHLRDPMLGTVLSVATPFIAFLPAEKLHVSGVLAVVVCGLMLARYAPRLISAESRTRTYSFWGLATYLLNAALFVLIGIELPLTADQLESHTLRESVLAVIAVTIAIVLSRVVWSFINVVMIRTLDRRPSQRARRVRLRQRVPSMWAGVRGGISLAAALSVPLSTDAGTPFVDRDFIIFVTGGTVLLTLVIQASTLPRVIRWARYAPDDAAAYEHDLARHAIISAALEHLDGSTAQTPHQQKVVDMLRRSLEKQKATLPNPAEDDRSAITRGFLDYETDLRLELIDAQRETLTTLRDEGEIDGAIYLGLESVLDSEEKSLRLTREARDGGLRGPE